MELNRKEFGKMQYRSGFGPFFNLFNGLRKSIQDEHREIIRKTPFGGLFKVFDEGLITENMCKKTYIDIIRIIKCFNSKTRDFTIGGRREKFTGFDIEELFGLPYAGCEININKRSSKVDADFVKRNLIVSERVSRQNIESAMCKVVTGKTQQDREDFVCLICLHFCITLLFCNSGNTISWNIASCCQDVRSIPKYNWAKATSDFLERQLVKDCEKPSSVSGCVAALPFWFCEKIGLIEPLKDRMDVPPKFVKWDIQDLQSSMCNIDVSSMTPVIASIGNKKDQVLEDACGGPASGNLRNKSSSVEPQVGNESNVPLGKNLRLSPVINGVAAKEVVEEVCGEPATGCLTYKSPSGVPQVGNESNVPSKKNLRSTHVINGVAAKEDVVEDGCHQVPTSLDCKTGVTEFRNKSVFTTSTIPEFDPSKMFQLTSTQDIILHGDSTGCGHEESPITPKNPRPILEGRQECLVNEENRLMKEEIKKLKLRLEEAQVQAVLYNELCVNAEVGVADTRKQCNDLSNDLQQLLDRIEQEEGFKNNESSPELKSWVIRLKHKHRRPKRLPGYVYEGIKTLREPKKAKADAEKHAVVKTGQNEIVKELTLYKGKQQESWSADEFKGKKQIGTLYGGHNGVKRMQQTSTTIDPSCMSVWIYLSNEDQDKLHRFLLCTDSGVPLWQGSCSAIYKDDLMDLLTKAAITCNVIDSFGETLQTEIINDASLKQKSLMMTTYCWEFLQKGDDNNIRVFLHDPLLEALAGADYVFFPMRHENQFHFTLLVLHKADEQWFHYDPRRPLSNSSNDPCFLNAQKLRDAVTSFLQFNSCIAPVVLSNGHRMRQPEKVGVQAIKSSLTNGEKQTFQWLKATDLNYPLWRSTNCPQQMDDSTDCGVTVMYYISTISKCQNMAPCFTENTMKEYRAKVINKFLHDGRSWKDE